MKLRKVLKLMIGFVLLFTVVACSTVDSAISKLEKEGYTVVEMSDEEINSLIQVKLLEYIESVYEIKDSDDLQVALMIEFIDEDSIDEYLEKIELSREEAAGLFYKNLYFTALGLPDEDVQYLIDIID
ncbi:hypothetical protein HF295_05270 [Hujiaoplasma nucleasis]|uniref:DUF4358 domain-containing protein n=1 Tax=Hujiaoplasma nucleasis TaxID=2725268 RepID=A0A7L6N483_9MOLU|nr:hypothetical protein [Hujiaoplasma nucleasis]QLY40302.1 hypothetical protein HF295_05270 [Hujiaoplasma nucleasis]